MHDNNKEEMDYQAACHLLVILLLRLESPSLFRDSQDQNNF